MPDIRCTYCHAYIAGVEYLEDYPDVVILYAHRTCHAQAGMTQSTAAIEAHMDDARRSTTTYAGTVSQKATATNNQ